MQIGTAMAGREGTRPGEERSRLRSRVRLIVVAVIVSVVFVASRKVRGVIVGVSVLVARGVEVVVVSVSGRGSRQGGIVSVGRARHSGLAVTSASSFRSRSRGVKRQVEGGRKQ
jgi:hypothetical protein